jgi:hypothetical protein
MRRNLVPALLLALGPVALTAQEAPNSGGWAALVENAGTQRDGEARAPSFGTGSRSVLSVVAHAFHPIDSGVTYSYSVDGNNIGIYRTNATGAPWLFAPIHLPTGSLIESVEFRFCDTSATRNFGSFLAINDKNGSVSQPTMVTSTAVEAPGCINRTFDFLTPVQVDNDVNAYALEVNLGGGFAGDNTIVLSQARVYYRLQVSPSPAVATFPVDVPTTQPFFRFIEALAASGVTAGCGPGMFCPEDPITRGQMAVFLAAALGMHFPN